MILFLGIPVLQDIAIIFILGIVLLVIGQRLKIPSMISFLITGLVIGPFGFGWISNHHTIEIMAEIGIILLLFTIGMEFSIGSLTKIRKEVFIGGGLQVVITAVVVTAIFSLFMTLHQAIFVGMFASLSSTAIVLKTMTNRGELTTGYGKAAFSVLIFQDLAIVPMMLILPLLSSGSGNLTIDLTVLFAKTIVIIAFVLLLSRFVAPYAMDYIAQTRSKEFFLVFIIGLCAAITYASGELGLSLGLGAFLAGLILAETQYAHQAMSDIIPFRDLFTVFFFVSIGMLLNLDEVVSSPLVIAGGLLIIMVIKALIIIGLMRILKYSLGQSIGIGLMLAQVGEFSIVMSQVAFTNNILNESTYQIFLGICLISMSVTPLLFILADKALSYDLIRTNRQNKVDLQTIESQEIKDHIVIIGYGVIGRSVARAAKFTRIPYAVIELNPETVKVEKRRGTPIIYGDANQIYVLDHCNMAKARIAVISIPDSQSVRHIVDTISKNYPDVYIIARTRYVNEVKPLHDLGAHQVLPEEYETSISIFARVLNHLGIGEDNSLNLLSQLRDDDYRFLRGTKSEKDKINLLEELPDITLCSIMVSDNSSIVGKSLKEINLIQKFGVTVIAIKHNDAIESNIHPENKIKKGDTLYVIGKPEKIREMLTIYNLTVK